MGVDEPSIPVLVERLSNLQDDVSEIKRNMATANDQRHTDEQIKGLVGALASERAERMAGLEAERTARERAIGTEKREREDADKAEANERKVVAGRLQVVEDRMEARKYNVGIAVALAVLGAVLAGIDLTRGLIGG